MQGRAKGLQSPHANEPLPLERVSELTDSMLAAARRGDWAAVESLRGERDSALAAGQSDPLAAQRPLLEQLLQNNNEVVALARTAQVELGEQLNQLRQGRRGDVAYRRR